MSAEILKDYPVQVEIPIAWGDMDAFQHVNNLVYLRHFETARMAYLERCDYKAVMEHTKVGPILRDSTCRYRIPLTYPGRVISATRVTHLKDDRFTMHHLVYSLDHKAVAAEGTAVIVCVDYEKNSKAPVPAKMRSIILNQEPVQPALS